MTGRPVTVSQAAPLLLAALVAVVYAQSLGYGFLVFDDRLHVYGNQQIAEGLGLAGLEWALTTFDKPYFMPLTRLSLMLDSTLFGMHAGVFRSVNVVLHFVNAWLVFLLLRRLSGRAPLALVVAALFAVHPQHVEAVAWVSQRKELLAALFGLLATIAYLRYRQSPRVDQGAGFVPRWAYMLALLLFLLSLLAKPTWIMLPVLLLLLDYRVANAPPRAFRLAWLDKLPFLLVTGAVLTIHLASSGYAAIGPTSVSLGEVAWLQRLANTVVIYAIYLASGVVPLWSSLYIPYPVEPFPLPTYLGCLLLLAAISLGAWLGRQRQADLFFGWAWFLVALVPVLGLLGAGEAVLVGDRWSYLPHIGLLFGLVSLAAGLMVHVDKRLKSALLVAVVLGFAFAAWSTTRAWANDEAYWVRTLAQTEGNHFAHFQLSDVYARRGDGAARERHLRAALDAKGDDPKYLLNLVIHLQNEGRDQEATPYLERMLGSETVPIPYNLALGQVLMYRGQLDLALRFLVRAASREPGTLAARQARDTALFTVALLHAVLDRPDAARALFDRLLELDPGRRSAACDRYRAELGHMPAVFDLTPARGVLEEACAGGADGPK